jgi:LuxR family maltose regulon positive regulatory protein
MSEQPTAIERSATRRARPARPRLPADAIVRPRLSALLDHADAAPLALVVAPAGFGKTTLVAQWLHTTPVAAAWLRLDDGDNDLDRFLRRLADAITAIAPLAARALADELGRPDRPPAPDLGALLASELSLLDDPLVIVLDDAEWLTAPLPLAFLQALVRELAGHARLCILSRAEPAIGLSALRLAGQVRDLGPRDLAFTTAEATRLFASLAPDLPAHEADAINRRVEGWAAGLRIAATTGAPAATTHDGDLAAFVVETILHRLTEAEGAATLRLALFERVSPSLAAAFLGASEHAAGDLLRRLRRHGMLLSDTGDGWTVITPRVREALVSHLAGTTSADELRELQRRAAHAAAAVGEIEAVIRHGLAAGDLAFVRDTVAPAVAETLDREAWDGPGRWLDLLPEAVIEADAGLILARIAIAIIRGHRSMLPELFARAHAIIPTLPLSDRARDGYLAELEVLAAAPILPLELDPDGWVARFAQIGDRIDPRRRYATAQVVMFRAFATFYTGRRNEAIRTLGSLEPPAPGMVDAVYARRLAAATVVAMASCAFAEADRISALLDRFARPLHLNISRSWGLIVRAYTAHTRGDTDAVIEHCTEIVRLADRPLLGVLREGMLLLAITFQATGRYDQAVATLDRLEEIVLDYGVPYHLSALAAVRARIALAEHGLTPAVRTWLASDDMPLDHQYFTVLIVPPHARIEALLALEEDTALAQATELAAAMRERLERAHLTFQMPAQLLVEALIARQTGATAEARALVLDALTRLERSEAPGVLDPYVDRLRPLLEDIARGVGPVPAFARRALAARQPVAIGDATADLPVGELLTERELDVLAMLAWRYSDREIGEAFGISPLTARKHAGNIYKKLGVSGRRRALEDAHRRGWSAPPAPR